MSKKAVINVRVDEDLKKNTQAIFDDLGLDMSTAITMYLKKVNACQGIPFDVKRTSIQEALAEIEQGKGETFESVEDWWEAMNADV
ncbi:MULTISPECIES: type II toxin-antitoxin system RelB/DinJ family antitoxin [Aerococcus]|uniref:type II toxin-antitoxin system RelB/DinJ family antitoxin n=1 Tax=Aerococcus urinae (strain CCUG 59500 / ACS-120-V-Col10a) TaxID=2976812 RepID=UPI000200E5B2|nr:type II toxin-antitoxin system RelB/DinJ family antitoxin [Aerococcus sp. Group 1]AEA00783.1 addiction module antitoxin, RelB/DinJ family [Aerococcus sp. Group 1]MCY3030409.1 type II toxin-antitoxin system RelB/DinJ family antitoxin [Aerococcus sp. Group 1]MCY3054839.1 type II toxin-antitoxin system RelB/DinJ family antitoxin [Aerococcus sp. Group 1]MCY3056569.1 type II toxin-antitoxin system RelB/DinJ family antitoxin [Aerococcus sp. Group 1]MCY3061849.1 type II toxin-antitoxin system RelB